MSVHSKDGRTWLTKLERIGELSTSDKHTVFNNIGHLICIDMLKEQYHQLEGNKAIGIDNVTKLTYGENLDENLNTLIKRIRRGTYEPKPSRICEIPKEDGSTRPLAISCFEDKLVQSAVSTILGKIYEPLFLPCSYGFRPNQNCHDALKALNQLTMKNRNGAIIEIDIRKYFNSIPHAVLMKLLEKKISDKRFLRLVNVLITAPILENENICKNTCGCPQGSIVSPIIANIYMHYVIDEWFDEIKHKSMRGKADQVRYADDMVFTFEWQREAKRFYEVLPKRLKKYGLEMHMDKSQLISAGHIPALRAHNEGKRLQTFNFLGFTCYWGKSKSGFWRLKYTSRKDRFAAKLKGLRNYLWENLNTDEPADILKTVSRVIKGWLNYHHISDNGRRVEAFLQCSRRIIFKWFNRKGRKHPLTWEQYNRKLDAIGFPKKGKTISMFAPH
ncbi:MAG: group II intron reverse transcriptase/maturase [Gammaproteobacteria bacterium]|nr:group II intron reverse transcriptase/maturase [Gammaproteobacteria bacterium]